MITGSAAILFSFIGFSEILAFLPMINLDYNETLKGFFKGISGLNFKFYDVGDYILLLVSFDKSLPEKSERFVLAGFESASFILNTSDVLLFLLITIFFAFFYFLLYKITKRSKKAEKFFSRKLSSFKYGAFIQLFEAAYMITFICACINIEIVNNETITELVQSGIVVLCTIIWALLPFGIGLFMHKNREKILDKKLDPEFTEKYAEFWADLRTDSLVAV